MRLRSVAWPFLVDLRARNPCCRLRGFSTVDTGVSWINSASFRDKTGAGEDNHEPGRVKARVRQGRFLGSFARVVTVQRGNIIAEIQTVMPEVRQGFDFERIKWLPECVSPEPVSVSRVGVAFGADQAVNLRAGVERNAETRPGPIEIQRPAFHGTCAQNAGMERDNSPA